jgi:PKD repeat protein
MRGRPPARQHASGRRCRATSVLGVALIASTLLWATSSAPASAVQASQPSLVSAVPADYTPAVNDGAVHAIAQVGDKIILGGTFTTVSPPGDPSAVYPLANTFAFNADTGAIDLNQYTPSVNGEVDTIIAGPAANEVYIGGSFTTVDGVSMRVALLNTTTGAIVSTWTPSAINGQINRLVLAGGRLFVGGTFTTVGGVSHKGLATLDPSTGKVTNYVDLSFTGHHNYERLCDPKTAKCADGHIGVKSMDINPAGTLLIAIGNFTSVSGVDRDQIAEINLDKSAASVNTSWATLAFTASCIAHSFDSYVRDVQFSPDGSYFVVASSGGSGTNSDGTDSSCDSASRYQTHATGKNIRPVWIDYTGQDSLWTVAVTGAAVYVGGHERWMNNPLAHDSAGAGAVPRPGIAALNPVSGLPYSWNPGREPRGAGCFALLATAEGLWIGSDTDYIGPHQYLRPKVAFFPLAGGETPPAEATPRLPGRVFLVGATAADTPDPDRFAYREFNGAMSGAEMPMSTGIAWGSVDGAFTVDGEVIYGASDGSLNERSFDGTTFGSPVVLDPWNDPTWDSVETGSGQTYQGVASTFTAEIPSVTSMFFQAGRLYYTLAGKSQMHWRWFEPQSGVVGATEFTVPGSTNWSKVAGAFLSRSTLFYADATTGQLRSVGWSANGPTGASVLVNASTDWASRGLFALDDATYPTPTPTAAFTANCGSGASCSFNATPWADPDGGVTRYKWSFGDGAALPLSKSATAAHTYSTNGTYSVTLTVIATSGAKASTTQDVTLSAPLEKVGYVGASTGAGVGKTTHVVVPRRAAAGDALLLFDSYASSTAKATLRSGWKLIGTSRRKSLTTAVYDKIARSHSAGSTVFVHYSRAVHSSVVIAVYRHTSLHPIESAAVAVGTALRAHHAPALSNVSAGSWLVGYWTQISTKPTGWTAPKTLKRRVSVHSRRRPADSAVLADTGGPCQGTCRLGWTRSARRSVAAAQWAIALAPALE